jgi:hypothetical protein
MNWLFSSARCADATPTGTPPPAAPPFTPPGAAVSGLPADAAPAKKKTNFMELPTPVKYEELQREIMSAFAFDFPPRPLRPRGVPSPGAKPRRAPSRLLASPRDEASRATRPKTTK